MTGSHSLHPLHNLECRNISTYDLSGRSRDGQTGSAHDGDPGAVRTETAGQGRRAPCSKLPSIRDLDSQGRLPASARAARRDAPRASATDPERPGQSSFLTRAVFADGRLWVLSDAGDLSSVTEARDARIAEALPEKAFDLCARDGHPLVITGANGNGSMWTLRQRTEGSWSVAAAIPTEGDGLLAMDCTANKVTLLTSRRLIDVDGRSAITLSGRLGQARVSSTYGTPDQVFVGLSAGEWGGGLRRIDRRTGNITVIERNSTGELCGGPLNTSCDPVTGIAAEPWNPDCIAATIGLVHMQPHGRVVEVCGDRVQRLYDKPYGNNRSAGRNKDDAPFISVAFFGLARDGDAVLAVGIDGIYRIGPGGAAQVPLPHFENIWAHQRQL